MYSDRNRRLSRESDDAIQGGRARQNRRHRPNDVVITASTLHSASVRARTPENPSPLDRLPNNAVAVDVEIAEHGGSTRRSRVPPSVVPAASREGSAPLERTGPHRSFGLPQPMPRAEVSGGRDRTLRPTAARVQHWDEIRKAEERRIDEPAARVLPRTVFTDGMCDYEENEDVEEESGSSTCSTKTKIFSAALVLFAVLAVSTTTALIYLKLHTDESHSHQKSAPTPKHVHMTERLQNQTLFCGVIPLMYAPDNSIKPATKTPRIDVVPSTTSRIQIKASLQPADPNQAPRQGSMGTAKAFPDPPPNDGSSEVKSRIVGGSDGIIRWQVSLWLSGKMKCGGSIIMSNWILTAAHCTHSNLEVSKWMVYAGASVRSKRRLPPAQNRSVIAIIPHDLFHADGTLDYDISLMRLNKPLVFNEEIKPICLPPQGFQFADGMHCFVSGWGQMDRYGILPHPDMLQYAQVDIIADATCNGSDWLNGKITNRMLCAGKKEGIQDACEGDSGGPLSCYWRERGAWMLAGSVSWGQSCGEPKRPGVYARISFFTNWIWSHIGVAEAKIPTT